MTTRVCIVAVVTGVLSLVAFGRPLDARQTYRALADAVSVHASVRSGNRPVAGLTADDFVLLDNGVPQRIEAMSVGTVPVDVTVVLDTSGSVSGEVSEQLRRDVDALIARLDARDRLRVLSFATTVREVVAMTPVRAVVALGLQASGGATAFFHALIAALLRPSEAGRPHLVLALSDGGDNVSLLGARDVLEVARRSDAVLEIVFRGSAVAFGVGWLPYLGPGDPARISQIADVTGGRLTRVRADRPVVELIDQAITEFKSSYVLWYRPTGVPRGGWHELTVRVRSGRYTVSARRGYVGG